MPRVNTTEFISPDLNSGLIREKIQRLCKPITREGSGKFLDGALLVPSFLSPAARQLLEGQIYSHGMDLTQVYRTSRAGFGVNELNITKAEEQIPMIGVLADELNVFIEEVFGMAVHKHNFQLRELAPGADGHPRHIDYDNGYDVHEIETERFALTSISLSLPISWDGGTAPAFIMEIGPGGREKLVQDKPGSLAIFGPQIPHSHPPTTDLKHPSLWLITQAFFKIPIGAEELLPMEKATTRDPRLISGKPKSHSLEEVSPVEIEAEIPSGSEPKLRDWMARIITDTKALDTIDGSEDRIRRAYGEMLSGYNTDPSTILNVVERVEDYDGIIVERNIAFTSICGHHFVPFFGFIDIAYVPGDIITGLGKLPRLAKVFSSRFQLQELLIKDIADQIRDSIGAKGVFVRARATHLCVHSRGPNSQHSETVCSYSLGVCRKPEIQSLILNEMAN